MEELITDCIQTVETTVQDYKTLAHYHYKTGNIGPCSKVYKLCPVNAARKHFPKIIGVIVYKMPIPNIKTRNEITGNFFLGNISRSERLKLVNQHIRYIARVIIDPRFRRLGLGTRLVEDTVKLQNVSIVETLTPIDFAVKMFKNAGFKTIYRQPPTRYLRFQNAFKNIGLTEQLLDIPNIVKKRMQRLDPTQKQMIEYEIKQFLVYYRRKKTIDLETLDIQELLKKTIYPSAYSIWHHPDIPNLSKKSGEQPKKKDDTS